MTRELICAAETENGERCVGPAGPIEVHLNTYRDHTKRSRARISVTVPLCPVHQYVHGYAWTRTAPPLRFQGAFPEDYAEFHKEAK